MLHHVYATYVSWIWGLEGKRVFETQEDNIQVKTLAKYSVLKYTEASTIQIYKIVGCKRGLTTIYLALMVVYV